MNDQHENQKRLEVLRFYRSWFSIDIYAYKWQLAQLTQADTKRLLYTDYGCWNELSHGTRQVGDGANTIRSNKVVAGVQYEYIRTIARSMEAYLKPTPVVVLQTTPGLQLVEGHNRATAYVLANQPAGHLLTIIGTAPAMHV